MSASLARMVAGVPVGWGRNTLTVKRRTRNVWSSETLSPATESRSPCPSRNYLNLSTNTIARNLASGLERYSTGLSTSANRTSNTGNNYCSELSTSAHISSSPVRRYSALSTNITASKSSSNSFNNCTGLSPTTSDPRMNCAALSTESTISKPMPRSAQNYTGLSPATNRSTCPRRNCVGISTSATASRSTTSPIDGPWVSATPRVCLHDVPTTIQAGGLPPNAPVTLAASLTDENGKQFLSNGHYISDDRGVVDVRVRTSVGGAYLGVFPMGLLTTLSPAPYETPGLRLYRRDTSLPWKIKICLYYGHEPLVVSKEPVAEVMLERHLRGPGVRRIPIHQGRVRGALYLPPGDGPFPGIVDMFGSIGGIMEFRSAMLASHGFASLALAIFNYKDLPTSTDELELDYFEEAVEVLLSRPEVIPDRCGAVAISKSGDIIFSMGTLFPKVKAVVGISCCTMALDTRFTYKGQLYKQGCNIPMSEVKKNKDGAYSGSLVGLFTNDNPAMIPVEEADDDTHFMVAVGMDDPWGFEHTLPPFRERMLRNNKYNFETILYPGTGHIIEPPYGPLIQQSFQRHFPKQNLSKETSQGLIMDWGGQPQPTCEAQVNLWHRMKEFIMNHIRDESPWYQNYLTANTNTNTPPEEQNNTNTQPQEHILTSKL